MEFTKDILFENDLTSGKTAKITYSGFLFKEGSEYVNLVSGFGENWENTTYTPMTKTDNGYVAEIEMQDFDTFNFCFSNEYNNWDNNNGNNYISPILPKLEEVTTENFERPELNVDFDSLENFMKEVSLEKQNIEFGVDYSTSIDDLIEDILGNTVQNSMSNDTESINDILNSISEEPIPEIEALFNELFFEEVDDVAEPVEEIVKTPIENAELVELFDELFETAEKPITTENLELNLAQFNLDGLVSDLLEPVISAPFTANTEASLFDNQEENTITEETSLVAINNELEVSSRRLGFFYSMKKRLSIACYKLFVKAPKEIAKQLGFFLD